MSLVQTAQDAADLTVAVAGVSTTAVYWLTSIINPLLSAGVGVFTIIYLFYRIKKMREK